MFSPVELEFIHYIHSFRTSFLDCFFKFLNYLDTPEFFFILIPLIWLGSGWKWGIKFLSILILGSVINHSLKEFFHVLRPYQLESSLEIIQVNGFSFPSGASQTAFLMGGLCLYYWKNHWKWFVIIPYVLLISFSRIYLAVHFPSDVLMGWLVGFCLLIVYLFVLPKILKTLEKINPFYIFLISQIISISTLISASSITTICICSEMMGLGLGLYLSHIQDLFLPAAQNKKEYILRGVVGIVGCFSLLYLFSLILPDSNVSVFLRLFIVTFWLSFGAQFLYLKFINYPSMTQPKKID